MTTELFNMSPRQLHKMFDQGEIIIGTTKINDKKQLTILKKLMHYRNKMNEYQNDHAKLLYYSRKITSLYNCNTSWTIPIVIVKAINQTEKEISELYAKAIII